jgi:hypothetical protein
MNALLWIVAHKALLVEAALALGAVVSAIVGALPANSRIVAWLGRASALTAKDAPGTFKMPGAAMPAAEEPTIVVNVNGVELTNESIEAALRSATKRTPPGGAA